MFCDAWLSPPLRKFSFLQVFVPVLSAARLFYRYGIASGRVFALELLGRCPSWRVCVEAKRDPLDVRIVL